MAHHVVGDDDGRGHIGLLSVRAPIHHAERTRHGVHAGIPLIARRSSVLRCRARGVCAPPGRLCPWSSTTFSSTGARLQAIERFCAEIVRSKGREKDVARKTAIPAPSQIASQTSLKTAHVQAPLEMARLGIEPRTPRFSGTGTQAGKS